MVNLSIPIILGTAREGRRSEHAARFVHEAVKARGDIETALIDVRDFRMSASNIIIFATPVYWYAMSGQMKMFFDRITDLIQIRKDVGRSLKGKKCYLITSGTDPELPPGFEESFSLTCKYFEMEYKGAFYYHVKKQLSIPQTSSEAAREFGRKTLNWS